MKRFLLLFLLLGSFSALPDQVSAAETDESAAAHKTAFDLAGAFSNDGFKLRDGHWSGTIEAGKTRVIQVNLYASNAYWFSVGATAQAKKLKISIYDEAGTPLTADTFEEDNKAAAGFSPSSSGPYYIKIEELDGLPATFCLIYSYK